MLSLKLPTISEKIALNGHIVEVYPLPLFFTDRLTLIYPMPSKENAPELTAYLLRFTAIEMIEALGLPGEIEGGRPGWEDPDGWPIYGEACAAALG